ncbi:MAG: DNA replication and repair protein RecF [Oscillospiraceae bacterium]|nr:DNA replication and repair protein RecF [Oscillospiraceae bacterium]
MTLQTISLRSWRSFDHANFSFYEGVNVISGKNGTGKTNLLESIFYLSCCRGLKGSKEADIINFDGKEAEAHARFLSDGREQDIRALLRRGAKRSFWLNQSALPSPRHLMGVLPAVFFQPEDLGLLRSGAASRRGYMDISLCQLHPRYLEALTRCRRLHEGKQKILRLAVSNPSYLNTLPDYNRGLCDMGATLTSFRAPFVEQAARLAQEHYKAISGNGERLEFSYRTQMTNADSAFEHMQERQAAELARCQCLVGSHRDDIDVFLNKRSARDFGSQGQTRTAVIAMKLAVRDLLAQEFGEPPLLLLDDVLSELDQSRQRYLLDHTGGGQVFISCCEPGKVTSTGKNIEL